jgi:hypothetical protein
MAGAGRQSGQLTAGENHECWIAIQNINIWTC